jgi:nicotinamide riboside kinase
MEKNNHNRPVRIVIDGPESTGKTELAKALATHFTTDWIPEYARDYISGLSRPYILDDVLHIANRQIEEEASFRMNPGIMLFLDTDLIITKVWLELVFNQSPIWIVDYLKNTPTDLYLLCQPDLPWVPDEVRENGGSMREFLYERYRSEIVSLGYPYFEVYGFGEDRLANAVKGIQEYFPGLTQ